MILNNNEYKCETGGIQTTSNFNIKASAHAFRILSDGLYSDKILSIVRELSCNAYDSHIAAGKKDIPFSISAPDSLEPHFVIRDYGTGLSEDDVINLYTTYFESTKQQSNEFIGALGLGSKSPFSYTDTFIVESFFNKEKKTYIVFINDTGMPTISKTHEELTEEDNGLKITIEVKPNDISEWRQKIESVVREFDTLPNLNFDIKNNFEIIKKFNNFEIRSGYGSSSFGMYIKQGVVVYPIDNNKFVYNNRLNYSYSIVLYAPIGDIDFTASRETISYTPQTIENIQKLVDIYDNSINNYINISMDKYFKNTIYEGISSLYEDKIISILRNFSHQKNYLGIDLKFNNYSLSNFKIDCSIFNKGFESTYHRGVNCTPKIKDFEQTYFKNVSILVLDTKITEKEIKYHFRKMKSTTLYIVNEYEYKFVLKRKLYPDTCFIKASSIKLSKDDYNALFLSNNKKTKSTLICNEIKFDHTNYKHSLELYECDKDYKFKGYYIPRKLYNKLNDSYRLFFNYMAKELNIKKAYVFNSIRDEKKYNLKSFEQLLCDNKPIINEYIAECYNMVNVHDTGMESLLDHADFEELKKEYNLQFGKRKYTTYDYSSLIEFLEKNCKISITIDKKYNKLNNDFSLLNNFGDWSLERHKDELRIYIKAKFNLLKESVNAVC